MIRQERREKESPFWQSNTTNVLQPKFNGCQLSITLTICCFSTG